MMQCGWERARASLRRSLQRRPRQQDENAGAVGDKNGLEGAEARRVRGGDLESFADLPLSPVHNADRSKAHRSARGYNGEEQTRRSWQSRRGPRSSVAAGAATTGDKHGDESDDDRHSDLGDLGRDGEPEDRGLVWEADSDTSDEDYAPDFSGFTVNLPDHDDCDAPVAPTTPDAVAAARARSHSPSRFKRRSIRPRPAAAANAAASPSAIKRTSSSKIRSITSHLKK